jgi:nucleoside-diphosphate-sugar epimerase
MGWTGARHLQFQEQHMGVHGATGPQQRPRQVVVLGARGRLGWAVVQAFARAGWQVLAQVRPGSAAREPLAGVVWMVAEAADTDALVRTAPQASVVVHAMNPSVYTAAAWARQAPALAEAAVALAHRLGALLMFPGNVYGYASELPTRLSPQTPQEPETPMGRIRLALEQQLATACTQGLHAVIVRAGDFYGSGQGSWLDRVLAKDIARGRFTCPGPLDVPHAWAYLPDLADTFVRVAEASAGQPVGGLNTVHFSGHCVRGHDWLRVLAEVAGHPLKAVGLPWGVMRLLALFKPELATLLALRHLWNRPHALDNTSLQALIGPEPHTPFEVAVRRALAG